MVEAAMVFAVLKNAEVVAWVCLTAGLVVLIAGVIIGLVLSLRKPQEAQNQVEEAKAKIDETKAELERARVPGLEAGEAASAAGAAAEKAEEAKSALEQVSSIIASLPEQVRFAGMLVLVGTLLISVATIQFGGVSLF